VKMRWKADLPKMPRLPRVPLVRGESAAFAPPPAPSAYREENPPEPPPAEFKAPSMLGEHRVLAFLFLAAVIAFTWYCWKAPQHRSVALAQAAQTTGAGETARTRSPDAAQGAETAQSPIYVETLPDNKNQ
jgi:hypothetical protein